MNPTKITNYRCTQCGRFYSSYSEAEKCCTNRDELKNALEKQADDILKNIPSQILTDEDYVRTVIGIKKLDKLHYKLLSFDLTSYYDIVKKKKGECIDYLENTAEKLMKKLDLELNKEVEVDGKTYVLFDADDIMSLYYADYEDRDYDLIREKRN